MKKYFPFFIFPCSTFQCVTSYTLFSLLLQNFLGAELNKIALFRRRRKLICCLMALLVAEKWRLWSVRPSRNAAQAHILYEIFNTVLMDRDEQACVCVFFPFILDIKFVGRTSRGHTGGRSHRISHPPSFCGACLNFSREKDSAIPFPRRP